MERFRFGEQAGPNVNKITFNGWLAVFEHDPGRLHIETAGPEGGVRSGLIIDKATAWKLGFALLAWSGSFGAALAAASAFTATCETCPKIRDEMKGGPATIRGSLQKEDQR